MVEFILNADGRRHRRISIADFEKWNSSNKKGYGLKYPPCNFPLSENELPIDVCDHAVQLVQVSGWLALRKYFKDVTEAQWIAIRQFVFERDEFLCQYCMASKAKAVDHVIPFSKFGASHPDNLVAACIKCNSSKSSIDLSTWMKRKQC